MKDSTVILLIVGGFALLFWAFSTGIVSTTGLGLNPATGKPYGTITVPQPTTNYSGYLAATTAPGVSSALNGALSGIGSGLNNLFSGWFGGSKTTTPGPNQTASASSPALAAQPGSTSDTTGQIYGPFVDASTFQGTSNPVGPVVSPETSYNATSGSAFDFLGLSQANSYDPTYSLTDPGILSA